MEFCNDPQGRQAKAPEQCVSIANSKRLTAVRLVNRNHTYPALHITVDVCVRNFRFGRKLQTTDQLFVWSVVTLSPVTFQLTGGTKRSITTSIGFELSSAGPFYHLFLPPLPASASANCYIDSCVPFISYARIPASLLVG
jgi:hypothetical protein